MWKPVVGFEGRYEVSDEGRVRSVDRYVLCRGGKYRRVSGAVLVPQKHSRGYAQVGLGGSTHPIHRVVALAHLGPRPVGAQIAHFDGDRWNNAAINLRYTTAKENSQDRIRHGRSGVGQANTQAKLTTKQVVRIRCAAHGGVPHRTIASKFDISKQHVSKLITRRRWAHV